MVKSIRIYENFCQGSYPKLNIQLILCHFKIIHGLKNALEIYLNLPFTGPCHKMTVVTKDQLNCCLNVSLRSFVLSSTPPPPPSPHPFFKKCAIKGYVLLTLSAAGMLKYVCPFSGHQALKV